MPQTFVHLRNHSEYSLSEGALRIKDMAAKCAEQAMPAVAITDSGNLFGIMEFSKACWSKGVQPIIGCEIMVGGSKLVVYAKNQTGYANLLKLVSKSFIEKPLELADLPAFAEGLLCLTASIDGELSQMLGRGETGEAAQYAAKLKEIFGDRLYIELTRHGLDAERKAEEGLIKIAYNLALPLVATNNCFFLDRKMHEAHDALLCIAEGKYVTDENRHRLNPEFYFKSPREMQQLFADIPEAIANTLEFARRCAIKAPSRAPILPSAHTQNGRSVEEELRAQATAGLRKRLALKAEINPHLTSPNPSYKEGNYGESLPQEGEVGGGKNFLYNPELTDKAKELRQNPTEPEKRLWQELRANQFENHKFKRQEPIGNYIADFINYEKKLIIEVDGESHTQQIEYDKDRDEYFKSLGFSTLRFWNNEVMQNIEGVLLKIQEVLTSPNPLLKGEGLDWQKPYFDRLDFELNVIINMQFPGYFLIVSDFIGWAKAQDIPVGPGRGSGAGSVVAWSLLITDVDPLEFGLLFERFLNPERVSMPDFDIDFCQERREEVIQYVRQKYGTQQVAQIITFGKLQARAVVRDVGRVLQMPYPEVDRISKMIPFNPVAPVTLGEAIEMDAEFRRLQREDERIAKLLEICLQLEGLNRHASTHAAGILIADRPLEELVPLYRDPRSDMPVSQFSMKDSESAGLVKFDFLGLRTLTLIDKAVKLIHARGEKLDLAKLPLEDKKVYEMLSQGETVGVFQLDSTLVRDAIRKMRPDCFGDIVALTSLCRPGPMENIPTYVARKHEKEGVEYPHEKLRHLLRETQGIIVYQEQVMEAAQILAGYSLGKADLLRRAMGKKIKAEMDEQRDMFTEGALENGIDKKKAAEIFDLIAKFAGYGFNKSHAVAYSLIAYHTAYLRCYFPVEFFTACMNLDIGDTDKLNFYKHEAMKQDIDIVPADVNVSEAVFVPRNGKIIYGLAAVKGVGLEAAKQIAAERETHGKFLDIFNFAERCDHKSINKKLLESLAKAGGVDSIHKNRAQVFESAELLSRYNNTIWSEKESEQISLFGAGSAVQVQKPALTQTLKWGQNELLAREYEALGFYLSDHPLHQYEEILEKLKVVPSTKIEEVVYKEGQKIQLAGVVATKKLRAGKKGRFGFAKLSDAYGVYEIVMYDDDLINYAIDLLDSNEPLYISAEAKKDEGGVRLIAESIRRISDVIKDRGEALTSTENLTYEVSGIEAVEQLCISLKKHSYIAGGLFKAKVQLVVHSGNREILLELPQHFALNDNAKEELLQLENVWV